MNKDEELEQIQSRMKDFIHILSHELRNPLTSAVGAMDLLGYSKESLEPDVQEIVDLATKSIRHMRTLITDIVAIALIDCGDTVLAIQPCKIPHIIQSALDEIEIPSNIQIVKKYPKSHPEILLDPDRFELIFEHLITNGISYSPAGGKLTLTVAYDETNAVISVADEGIGIPAHSQKELFSKFYRAKREAMQHIDGSGLGLTICKELVTMHGGTIECISDEGKGSTFTMTVPLQTT